MSDWTPTDAEIARARETLALVFGPNAAEFYGDHGATLVLIAARAILAPSIRAEVLEEAIGVAYVCAGEWDAQLDVAHPVDVAVRIAGRIRAIATKEPQRP